MYDFLFNHVFNNIREGSVNSGRDGEGAREALEVVEGLLEDKDGEPRILQEVLRMTEENRDMATKVSRFINWKQYLNW